MGYTSILDGCCYAEYLHINKHTFGARENIYYLKLVKISGQKEE